MGFREDIRTIAETDKIKELLDKKSDGVEALAKEAIKVTRSVVSQQGTGNPYQSTGDNAGGGTIPGYDADGHPLDIPLAPPPTPAPNPSQVTTGGDTGSGGTTGGGGTGGSSGDKTGSGTTSDSSAGGSRTDSKNQTNPTGSVEDDIAAIRAAMEAAGIPEDVIEQAIADYKQSLSEPGTHEVSDVYNGEAGYTPQYGSWSSVAPNSGESVPTTGDVQKLNALVGQDPKNTTTSVRVNLDGREPKPSDAETAAAGQGDWTDANTPPIRLGWDYYEPGYYFKASFAGTDYFSPDAYDCGASAAQAWADSVGPGTWTFNGFGSSPPDPSEFLFTVVYTVGGPLEQFIPLTKVSCSATPNPVCTVTPDQGPLESAWPIIGMYMLTMKNGKFTPNVYDSEVPIEYSDPVSKVDIYSLITENTYTLERAANGGYLLSNKTNPDYFLYFGSDRSLKTVAPMNVYKFYNVKS